MSSAREIRISITSALNAAGIEATKREIDTMAKSVSASTKSMSGTMNAEMGKIGNAIKSLGSLFGGLGSKLSHFFGEFVGGNIWAAAAVGIMALAEKLDIFGEKSKKVLEDQKKGISEYAAKCKEAAAAIESTYTNGISAVDKMISKREKEISSVTRLAIAEKELQKQRALASGDKDSAAKIQGEIDAISATSEEDKEKARVDAYKRRREIATEASRKAEKELDRTAAETQKVYDKRKALVAGAGARADKEADTWERLNWGKRTAILQDDNGAEYWEMLKRNERNNAFNREKKALYKSDEWKATSEELKTKTDVSRKASDVAFKMRMKVQEIDEEEKARLAGMSAKKAEDEAKKIADSAKAFADAADKMKASAEKSATELERIHQKEIAAKIKNHQQLLETEKETGRSATVRQAAAESKLQRAWGWYRDKDSMAAQMEEEKKEAAAQKQFEKDFEKLKDRKGREWRKAENLTVEEEAVRRVAMAREEKEQADKWAQETAENTRELAAKLDELLSVKG